MLLNRITSESPGASPVQKAPKKKKKKTPPPPPPLLGGSCRKGHRYEVEVKSCGFGVCTPTALTMTRFFIQNYAPHKSTRRKTHDYSASVSACFGALKIPD